MQDSSASDEDGATCFRYGIVSAEVHLFPTKAQKCTIKVKNTNKKQNDHMDKLNVPKTAQFAHHAAQSI